MIRNAYTPGLFLLEVIGIDTCSWGCLLNKTTTATTTTTTTITTATTTKYYMGKRQNKEESF